MMICLYYKAVLGTKLLSQVLSINAIKNHVFFLKDLKGSLGKKHVHHT